MSSLYSTSCARTLSSKSSAACAKRVSGFMSNKSDDPLIVCKSLKILSTLSDDGPEA